MVWDFSSLTISAFGFILQFDLCFGISNIRNYLSKVFQGKVSPPPLCLVLEGSYSKMRWQNFLRWRFLLIMSLRMTLWEFMLVLSCITYKTVCQGVWMTLSQKDTFNKGLHITGFIASFVKAEEQFKHNDFTLIWEFLVPWNLFFFSEY